MTSINNKSGLSLKGRIGLLGFTLTQFKNRMDVQWSIYYQNLLKIKILLRLESVS